MENNKVKNIKTYSTAKLVLSAGAGLISGTLGLIVIDMVTTSNQPVLSIPGISSLVIGGAFIIGGAIEIKKPLFKLIKYVTGDRMLGKIPAVKRGKANKKYAKCINTKQRKH